MYETVACPKCQRRLRLPAEHLGKQVSCPSCQAVFAAGVGWSSTPAPPEADTGVVVELPPAPLPTPAQPAPVANDHHLPAPETDERPIDRWKRKAAGGSAAPVKPPSRRNWALFMLLGLIAVACVVLVFALRDPGPPVVPFFGQMDQPGPDGVRASAPVDQLNAEQQVEQMQVFFRRLSTLLIARDQNRIGEILDTEPMLAPVFDQHGMRHDEQRRQALSDAGRGLASTMLRDGTRWAELELGQIRLDLDRSELVVVTSHRDKINGGSGHTRWWIGQKRGFWRIRDFENLDIGLRVSAVIGSLFERGMANVDPALKKEITTLRDAADALTLRQNTDETERLLDSVRLEVLPKPLAASVFLMRANIRIRQQKDAETIKLCQEALQHHADTPGADFLLAIAHARLNQHETALKHARAYHHVVGDDPDACFEVGYALHNLLRWKEAAPYYRKALDQDPNHHDAFANLLACATQDVNHDDIGARLAKMTRPQDHFERFAKDRWQQFDAAALERLCLAMRKVQPRHADAEYYLALAHAELQRPQPALAAFRSALEFQDNALRRDEYYREFAKVSAYRGSAVAAYRGMPDGVAAFRFFALALKQNIKLDDLSELVEQHAKDHPKDPYLLLYQAEVLALDDQHALADKAFTRAAASIKDDAQLVPFQHSRVLARYRSGDVLGAYRDISPRAGVFEQLVNLCWQDKKIDEMAALVDAHAKNDPNDPRLQRHRWRITIHTKKYDDAGAIVKGALQNKLGGVGRKELIEDFLSDMVDAKQAVHAYRLAPDPTQAFSFLVEDLLGMNQTTELRNIMKEHAKKFPRERLLPIIEAELALRNRDFPAAVKHFAAGWNDLPKENHQRWIYSYLTAHYKAGQAVQAYQRTGRRPEDFRELARLMLAEKKTDAFVQLLEAHRPQRGADPHFGLYEARLKIIQGQRADALFLQAWEALPDLQKPMATTSFLADLRAYDKDVEGYACVQDKQAAFQSMIWPLRNKKHVDLFAKLIDLHAKHHPDDARLILERGELHLLRDEPKEAERLFTQAKQRGLPADANHAQTGLCRARIRLGQIERTYRELGPGPTTFLTLATHCASEKNAGQLRALLAVHRQEYPKAKNLLAWDLEAVWLSKDYEATLRTIRADRARLLESPGNRWKSESYVVRSLVRLNRAKEALQEAEAFSKRVGGPELLVVLALAASGDVAKTLAWLDEKNTSTFFIEDCYFDDDLGPILRGDAFKAFRSRFPEPTTRLP